MKRLVFALLLSPSLAFAQTPPPPPAQPTPPATSAQMVTMQWEAVAKQQDAYASAMKAMAVPLQNLLNEDVAMKAALDEKTRLAKWWEEYATGLLAQQKPLAEK